MLLASTTLAPPARSQIRPEQVCVLVNQSSVGFRVADMYRRLRGVPEENELVLRMGRARRISREQYLDRIARRVREWLEKRPDITTIVVTHGVPYVVTADEGNARGLAALDSELAAVLSDPPVPAAGWRPNPLFVKTTNPGAMRDPRRFGMVFVSRLDGPGLDVIERMVSDAIATEQAGGLAGGVFVDTRGKEMPVGYGLGDSLLREGHDRLAGAGFRTTLDQ